MTMAEAVVSPKQACDIAIAEAFGWRRHRRGAVTLWLKGWIDGVGIESLARRIDAAGTGFSPQWVADLLRGTDGHFALAATGTGWGIAAVDWIRSIPLAATPCGGLWTVHDQPEQLRRMAGLGEHDPDAVLSIAMAGYTVDTATLYRGIELLGPGELFWFSGSKAPERIRYYAYRPWNVKPAESDGREKELAERTLRIMERTLASLDGRPLVVPLSAGRDSRLIVSAARHLGYENVRCFTYGRAGNFEAEASKAIAEKLGYPWTFAPATISGARRFFASDDYARYLEFADSGASVPFVQDMAPLMELKRSGYVPGDAVIVNGNSGDYISGNHITPELQHPAAGLGEEARWGRITDALVDKHFGLWRSLGTPANKARIAALLRASVQRGGGAPGDPETDHGLYEYAEFQDRQCKYVVTGQRIYEFLGHDWRLPLWDNAYLRFWEGVPLAEKAGQALYARMLENANWGGVWRDIPVNRKTIRPGWLVPLRLAAKALHAPLGRERWHRFERRYLQYWMDTTCSAACVPYSRVRRDRRGARHHIAWLTELYLARHGVALDDLEEKAA